MKEYRVKITVRNNLLLSAIETAGFAGHGGLAAFAAYAELSPQTLSAMVSMRLSPLNADGEFTQLAKTLMEVLGAAPSDLWTERQLTTVMRSNSREISLGLDAVENMLDLNNRCMSLTSPEQDLIDAEKKAVLNSLIDKLRKNQRQVIAMRFGLRGHEAHTLEEVAETLGVTREQVRNIEGKALRALRAPRVIDVIVENFTEELSEAGLPCST